MNISRDQNEPEIIEALEVAGCLVQPLMQSIGSAVPDLLVATPGPRRTLFLVEVKRRTGPPSSRKLRSSQILWHEEWAGAPVFVVDSAKGVLDVLQTVLRDAG
jgi:hypothetical protein